MNALAFSKEVIDVCSKFQFVRGIDIILLDEPIAKIRILIKEGLFIEVFFNAESNKYSFALIKDNKRIYGIDNTKEWHIHPFNNPESHIPSKPVSFLDFMHILEKERKEWE
ncbi:MAG TPA: hypothetical protein ENI35_00555 [Candidatus Desulfofervidus auxilii]|uniref:Uncharacterized protein n=1 Tax=Desulfofervidus auxilii TaxID=1621989 RepID=A0A7C1VWD4_DESA2|nr:hypothetical protein [Candidatus Desulfofervidus auxilii]